jgi:hypothetical protein
VLALIYLIVEQAEHLHLIDVHLGASEILIPTSKKLCLSRRLHRGVLATIVPEEHERLYTAFNAVFCGRQAIRKVCCRNGVAAAMPCSDIAIVQQNQLKILCGSLHSALQYRRDRVSTMIEI